jgi:hypothetical protein
MLFKKAGNSYLENGNLFISAIEKYKFSLEI